MAHRSPRVRQFCVQANEIIHERLDAGEKLITILRGMTSDSLRKLCSFHCCFLSRSPRKNEMIAALAGTYDGIRDLRSERINSKEYNIQIDCRNSPWKLESDGI